MNAVIKLVDYALQTGLIEESERLWAVNALLETLRCDALPEIDVPEACVGKTLAEADLRKKSGVTVLCIRRPDPKNSTKPLQIVIPNPNDAFEAGDKLIVFGTTAGIDALSGKA